MNMFMNSAAAFDPISINLLSGPGARKGRPGALPATETSPWDLMPMFQDDSSLAIQSPREFRLCDVEGLFPDEISAALQTAASDALSSNVTQLQMSVLDLSASEGLQLPTQSVVNSSTNMVTTDSNVMQQLNRTLIEGLQHSFSANNQATAAKGKGARAPPAPKQTTTNNQRKRKSQPESPPTRKDKAERPKPAKKAKAVSPRISEDDTSSADESKKNMEDFDMDPDDLKKLSKREKNILACRKARKKRREKMANLEDKLKELEEKNQDLERRLRVTSLPLDCLPADSSDKVDVELVRSDRVTVIKNLYRAMNSGKMEQEAQSFHPNCVMVKPMEEVIGAQSLWKSWETTRRRFASMHWDLLNIEPLDVRGDQIRTEWTFKGLLKADIGTVQEYSQLRSDEIRRLADYANPRTDDDGKLTTIEMKGRSYYIFTADNRLVFINHNFVKAPIFKAATDGDSPKCLSEQATDSSKALSTFRA